VLGVDSDNNLATDGSYKPLIVVFPPDFSLPIHYTPENDDSAAIFTQTLSAILLASRKFDFKQIKDGLSILEMFINERLDRKILYAGTGAILILPSAYRKYLVYLNKLRDAFKKFDVNFKLKFWDELGDDKTVVLFAMDMSLRTDECINRFLLQLKEKIEEWDSISREYIRSGEFIFK